LFVADSAAATAVVVTSSICRCQFFYWSK